jgi:hypothetical protein
MLYIQHDGFVRLLHFLDLFLGKNLFDLINYYFVFFGFSKKFFHKINYIYNIAELERQFPRNRLSIPVAIEQ